MEPGLRGSGKEDSEDAPKLLAEWRDEDDWLDLDLDLFFFLCRRGLSLSEDDLEFEDDELDDELLADDEES